MSADGVVRRDERVDASFLKNFEALSKSGALDDLATLRRENRELEMLVNDASVLLSKEHVEELADYASERLRERFAPVRTAMLYRPPRGGSPVMRFWRLMDEVEERFDEETFETLLEPFAQSPRVLVGDELASSVVIMPSEAEAFGSRLAAPLLGPDGPYGIVLLASKLSGGEYSAPEAIYVDRLVRFLSGGIQNRLHYESMITDGKTGLFTHDYFMRRLEGESARLLRRPGRAGLIMIDIDHFKRFNDTWGHQAGDAALIRVASAVRGAVRSEDIVARFGGEEFCVLAVDLGQMQEEALMALAERIREAVKSEPIPWNGRELSVTVSVGCSWLDPARGRGPERGMELADRALYTSKETGRNRCTLAGYGLLSRASLTRE
ncbi:MAG: GGDEF domain-containing protein [Spirochaetia bacterium]|nr:GGDEF domain-containing protein [Spirochaetia bacterium]